MTRLQDIVETVLKSPKEFVLQAAQLLEKLVRSMMEMGFERFMKQLEANLAVGNTKATPDKQFRKPPFLRGPGLNDFDRSDKLADLEDEDKPRPRLS